MNFNLFTERDGYAIYVADGKVALPGDFAVRVEQGGRPHCSSPHGLIRWYAMACLGKLSDSCDFEAIVYGKDNAPNQLTVGALMYFEGWDPPAETDDEDTEDTEDDGYDAWVMSIVGHLLDVAKEATII